MLTTDLPTHGSQPMASAFPGGSGTKQCTAVLNQQPTMFNGACLEMFGAMCAVCGAVEAFSAAGSKPQSALCGVRSVTADLTHAQTDVPVL